MVDKKNKPIDNKKKKNTKKQTKTSTDINDCDITNRRKKLATYQRRYYEKRKMKDPEFNSKYGWKGEKTNQTIITWGEVTIHFT